MDSINVYILSIFGLSILLAIWVYVKERLGEEKFAKQNQKRHKKLNKEVNEFIRKNKFDEEGWKQVKKKET